MINLLFPRRNNLEWLRLIFALQVVITHAQSHFKSAIKIPDFISNFPGVPAFFFVSGFLIYSSYLNAPGKRYFENRFLRLFPGLVVVTLGGGGVILLDQGWHSLQNNYLTFLLWFLLQVTFGQAYNPELFRTVGVGVINGSLWTITVEIIFYIMIPLIVWLEKRFRFILAVLILASFLVYALGPFWLNGVVYRNKSIFDLISLTPVVWGWMFGFGIVAVKYYLEISRFFRYAPLLLIPIIVMSFYGNGILFAASGNRLGLLYFICYAVIILWIAFWVPPANLPFDFSFGAYIWHMPIINLLLVLEFPSMTLAIFLTVFTAAVSWFLIEKPMLKLKHQSLRQV